MKFSRDDDNTHIKFIFREKLRFRKMFVRNFRYYFFFGPIFFILYAKEKKIENFKCIFASMMSKFFFQPLKKKHFLAKLNHEKQTSNFFPSFEKNEKIRNAQKERVNGLYFIDRFVRCSHDE